MPASKIVYETQGQISSPNIEQDTTNITPHNDDREDVASAAIEPEVLIPVNDETQEEDIPPNKDEFDHADADADIGLIIKWRRDQSHTMIPVISHIVPWSPAMWEGTVRIGDVLTSVNGHHMKNPIDTEHLFGPQDSEVRISVLRPRADRKVEYQYLSDFEGPLWPKALRRDREYRERPSGAVIRIWPSPAKYQERSLSVFGLNWSLRRACIALHETTLWQVLCVVCILANLVLLSMTDPLEAHHNPANPAIQNLDLASFGLDNFFVLEALVKSVVTGFAVGHNAYLDTWLNRIDFLVVLCSVADICVFALKHSLVPLLEEPIILPYEYTTFVTSFKAMRAIRSCPTCARAPPPPRH